jgi:hypothetical protein
LSIEERRARAMCLTCGGGRSVEWRRDEEERKEEQQHHDNTTTAAGSSKQQEIEKGLKRVKEPKMQVSMGDEATRSYRGHG